MTITYSPCNPAQLELLIEMMHELDRDDAGGEMDEVREQAALTVLIQDAQWGRIWFIAEGETIIGYAILTFGFSVEWGGRSAEIDELYIRAAYRGRGIGTQVIAFLTDFCRANGICSLHLEVFNHNRGAYRFYRRRGFRERDSCEMSLKL